MKELTAFSVFSGIGGFCEGVRLAGFRVTGAVELDRFACENYRLNYPNTPLFEGDIAEFLPSDRSTRGRHLDEYVQADKIDLLFGGPPCQGYSQIGPREITDPRNDMYKQVCRLAAILKPRFIAIENVPNMLLMKQGFFRRRILKALSEAGYDNQAIEVVNASEYGVPQARKRVFIIAARSRTFPVRLSHAFEMTLASLRQPQVSVNQAISDLPKSVCESGDVLPYPSRSRLTRYQQEMRLDCDGTLYTAEQKMAQYELQGSEIRLHNHHTKDIRERRLALIKLLAPGKKADSLPKEIWNRARPEKWRRFDGNKPAHTLMAQMHRDLSEWVHPKHHRWITVREALRLQSFHDGFLLGTSEWQQLKQIGNAVPPLLARVPAMALQYALSLAEADCGRVAS